MKHQSILLLFIFLLSISCTKEAGLDGSSGNSNKSRNGGTNIFDDIISDANADVISDNNGCISGFEKITVYSNAITTDPPLKSYYSCIKTEPLTHSSFFTAAGYYYIQRSECYVQSAMSTCSESQLWTAHKQGVINIIGVNTIFFGDSEPWVFDEDGATTNPSPVTSAKEYCCYW